MRAFPGAPARAVALTLTTAVVALTGHVSPAGAVPGLAGRLSGEASLKAEVAATAKRLATATEAWQRGQARLGAQVQRKVELQRELSALHEQRHQASSQLASFAGNLYRNPVNPVLSAMLAGDPRRVSDVIYLRRRANLDAAAAHVANTALTTYAQRVDALLMAQERAARAVTQLQSQQEDRLDRLQADAAASQVRLKRYLDRLKAREALARARGAMCSGGVPFDAANGFLPPGALCPLRTAPGHRLVAPAAQAFDAMSNAFRAEHGAPLCVTDSYRDYASQVDVFRRKPSLAATPGRSNHGLGVAVDLCGGVQRFGTDQHEWMKQQAGQFGWVHPDWAEPDGSRPEPWHWEFRGV